MHSTTYFASGGSTLKSHASAPLDIRRIHPQLLIKYLIQTLVMQPVVTSLTWPVALISLVGSHNVVSTPIREGLDLISLEHAKHRPVLDVGATVLVAGVQRVLGQRMVLKPCGEDRGDLCGCDVEDGKCVGLLQSGKDEAAGDRGLTRDLGELKHAKP
jgi:hypothetical protein